MASGWRAGDLCRCDTPPLDSEECPLGVSGEAGGPCPAPFSGSDSPVFRSVISKVLHFSSELCVSGNLTDHHCHHWLLSALCLKMPFWSLSSVVLVVYAPWNLSRTHTAQLVMVVHTCHPATQEAEAWRSHV